MIGRLIAAAGLAALVHGSAPALAVTPKQKMETCKFGADHQKLAGGARKSFMSKCMAGGDGPARKPKAAPKPQ